MTVALATQVRRTNEALAAAHKKEAELVASIPTLEGTAQKNALNDLFMEQIRIRQLTKTLTALEAVHKKEV